MLKLRTRFYPQKRAETGSLPLIALLRRLAFLIKKDRLLIENYERSHPHFLRYLALDAILSVGLVFGGFLVFAPDSLGKTKLVHAGAVVLTSKELVEHIKHERIVAYWLGPVSGYENTLNHEIPGVVDFFYLPTGADPTDHSVFLYEVKTYLSQKIWDAHTHPLLASANTKVIAVNKDLSVRINPTSMKGVIATYADKAEILAIAYPAPQTLNSMIMNVESLRLVG